MLGTSLTRMGESYKKVKYWKRKTQRRNMKINTISQKRHYSYFNILFPMTPCVRCQTILQKQGGAVNRTDAHRAGDFCPEAPIMGCWPVQPEFCKRKFSTAVRVIVHTCPAREPLDLNQRHWVQARLAPYGPQPFPRPPVHISSTSTVFLTHRGALSPEQDHACQRAVWNVPAQRVAGFYSFLKNCWKVHTVKLRKWQKQDVWRYGHIPKTHVSQ